MSLRSGNITWSGWYAPQRGSKYGCYTMCSHSIEVVSKDAGAHLWEKSTVKRQSQWSNVDSVWLRGRKSINEVDRFWLYSSMCEVRDTNTTDTGQGGHKVCFQNVWCLQRCWEEPKRDLLETLELPGLYTSIVKESRTRRWRSFNFTK